MSGFLPLYESGAFYDNTARIAEVVKWEHVTVHGGKNTGLSTFLSTLAYYLDDRVDSIGVFRNLAIGAMGDWGKLRQFLNHCRVVFLDCSDFACRSFPEAEAYFQRKMTELYRVHVARLMQENPNFVCSPRMLRALEGKEGTGCPDLEFLLQTIRAGTADTGSSLF